MSLADPRGVPVSTGTADLIDQLEAAHELSLSFRGDPVAAIDKTVKRLSILTPNRRAKLTPLSGTAEVVPVVNRWGDRVGF